jgi:glutamate racemase
MSKPIEHPQSRQHCPIGVFDSGLGGLRVLDRLMESLPDERFVYLGDTLHMPYGEKTPEQVSDYVAACLNWLFEHHQIKMMVVACNTAASVASHNFNRYPDTPFLDPVTPICQWLKTDSHYRQVGVMATPATAASNRYELLLKQLQSTIQLTQIGCNNLATVIEEGRGETDECLSMLQQYVAPLVAHPVEAIVLGCTHYPYVMHRVVELVPETIDVLDPAVFMALEAKRILQQNNLACPQKTGRRIAEVNYFVTDEPDQFYETSLRMPFEALAMKQPTVVSVHAPAVL